MAKIALYQMFSNGTIQANLEKSLRAVRTAAQHQSDLIFFPELQLTDFFPQYAGQDVSHYAVTLQSEIIQKFQDVCRECRIMAVPNVYLKENGNYYDASILINKNGEIQGIQKMVHIAQAVQFYEQDYYAPSDDGFHVFDTEIGKIGIVVCFDRHYPESIRTEALKGAELILIPTANTKSEPSELFEWEIRVQAFQNSAFIAMCNRTEREGEMQFSGESLVIQPDGGCLIKADDTEQILYADLDLQTAPEIRHRKPYTSLRNPEFYL